MGKVLLANLATVAHGNARSLQTILLRRRGILSRLRNERQTGKSIRSAKRCKLRPHKDRLRRGDAGVGVAHLSVGDHASFQDKLWLDSEECRLPKDKIGQFARLDT